MVPLTTGAFAAAVGPGATIAGLCAASGSAIAQTSASRPIARRAVLIAAVIPIAMRFIKSRAEPEKSIGLE